MFYDKIQRESFEAFKEQLDEGRALGKWAVHHFLNSTKGKKK
jgi:hypothetical protein